MQTKTKPVKSKTKSVPKETKAVKRVRKTSPFAAKFRKVWPDTPEARTTGMSIQVVLSDAMLQRMYERVLKEKAGTKPDYKMTKLEEIIRNHIQLAVDGDDQVAEQILCQIWGTQYEYFDEDFVDGLNKDSNFSVVARRIFKYIEDGDVSQLDKAIISKGYKLSANEMASPTN